MGDLKQTGYLKLTVLEKYTPYFLSVPYVLLFGLFHYCTVKIDFPILEHLADSIICQ